MKTITLLISFLFLSIQFCSAKGCTKEINIGGQNFNSNNIFIDQIIAQGDSTYIGISCWGECNSGNCMITSMLKLELNGVLIDSSWNGFKVVDSGIYVCSADYDCGPRIYASVHVRYQVTGISEAMKKQFFTVFPVPAINFISINNENIERLIFYDLSGKEYFQIDNPGNLIDVTPLQTGFYLMTGITRDDKKIYGKILKQ